MTPFYSRCTPFDVRLDRSACVAHGVAIPVRFTLPAPPSLNRSVLLQGDVRDVTTGGDRDDEQNRQT